MKMNLRRTIIIILASVMLFGCGVPVMAEEAVENSAGDITTYSLGETVSTDIWSCTLETAQFTIALNDVLNEDFLTPKEYNSAQDINNEYVAKIGHTLVSFTLHVTNKDRAKSSLGNTLITIIYDGEEYFYNIPVYDFFTQEDTFNDDEAEASYNEKGEIALYLKAWSSDKVNWSFDNTVGVRFDPGESLYVRGYMDIPIEPTDLNDPFEVQISLRNSDGDDEDFIYCVNE